MEVRAIIQIGNKEIKILDGKDAEAVVKGVRIVLNTVGASKKIGAFGINIVDKEAPNFSYGKAALEALEEYELNDPREIASYILWKRKSQQL